MSGGGQQRDALEDYLMDLRGYRILPGVLSASEVKELTDWLDRHGSDSEKTLPPVGTWIGDVTPPLEKANPALQFASHLCESFDQAASVGPEQVELHSYYTAPGVSLPPPPSPSLSPSLNLSL